MWTLWIMVTTANYPDVMMPAYNEIPLASLYFISFMMISFFFIMGVVLASIVNSYQNDDDMRKAKIKELRQKNLLQAFQLLDKNEEGWVDRETIMSVFLVLNEDCPEIRYIPPEEAELLFAVLDSGGENRISESEFMSFCKVMLLQFERASAYTTFIEHHFPSLFHSESFQSFSDAIKSNLFEHVVDAVVLLNAVFVAIQSYPQLVGEPSYEDIHIRDGQVDTVWERFQTAFTVIYCIEMVVKILVLGWKR
jgi:two pore calcium channel protein